MNRLITIPFSHFCEKARWGLEYAGVPFREEGHLPMLHWRASFGAGGGRTVPVLTTPEGVLSDSTDILHYADRAAPPARKLYGAPDVESLEEIFDTKLGPATRRLGYYFLLPDPKALKPIMRRNVPKVEAAVIELFFPIARRIMKRGMRIDDAGAERSLGRIREVFAMVNARLAVGRRYLDGDRFSAADLTFAALSAPFILPKGNPLSTRKVDELPERMRKLVEEFRVTPAGKFAARMYAEERRPGRV